MWRLKVHNKAAKALPDLPELAGLAFDQLARELMAGGPRPQGWPNYGKIKGRPSPLPFEERPPDLCGRLAGTRL